MVLLNKVIQVWVGAVLHTVTEFLINRLGIGFVAIRCHSVGTDIGGSACKAKEGFGGGQVAMLA